MFTSVRAISGAPGRFLAELRPVLAQVRHQLAQENRRLRHERAPRPGDRGPGWRNAIWAGWRASSC
jgi:hypothetical protein